MTTNIRKATAVQLVQDPSTVNVRKASAVAFVSDVGLQLRQITGYAFESPGPGLQLRQIAGYVFETPQVGVPVSKTGDLALYDLINGNRVVSTVFSASNTTLGTPTALGSPDANGHNTSIRLTAKAGSGYSGSTTFYYKRRPLTDLNPGSISLGTIAADTTVWALLPTINSVYGWNLTQQDVVNGAVAANATVLALVAASGSYLFTPGTTVGVGVQAALSVAVVNTKLTGFNSASGAGPTSYSATVLADTPYAYYRLNEATGTSAKDSSGNNRNGTYTGALTLANGALPPSGAKYPQFPGASTAYVDITAAKSFCAGSQWTFEAWVSVAAYTTKGGYTGSANGPSLITDVGDTGSTSPGTGFEISLMNFGQTQSGWYYWPKDNLQVASTATPLPVVGEVAHIVFTYNAGTLNMYKNGTLIQSFTGATAATVRTFLRIGGSSWVGGPMSGLIGEVALYTTALSQARIQAHYAAR